MLPLPVLLSNRHTRFRHRPYLPRPSDFQISFQDTNTNGQSDESLQYRHPPAFPTYKRRYPLTRLQASIPHVLIQQQLPAVGLVVAHPYLLPSPKDAIKKQARQILRLLHAIKPAPSNSPQLRRTGFQFPHRGRISNFSEPQLLFLDADSNMGFTHNDFNISDFNISDIMANDDRITWLMDREMAAFFSWKGAGEVHGRIKTLQTAFCRCLVE